MAVDASELRMIGFITSAHGIKGEVVVKPTDDDAPWVGKVKRIQVTRPNKPSEQWQISTARRHGDKILIKFMEVPDRTMAETLRGTELFVAEADLPALEADEFYADAMSGLTAFSADSDRELGTVLHVLSSAAGDFLEVDSPHIKEPVMVPFNEMFVPEVDMEKKTVKLRGLDDLFPVPTDENA